MKRAFLLALVLATAGCSLFPRRQPEPQRVPVACAPAAMAQCEVIGATVPEALTADTAALLAELAVRAWTACRVRHAELIRCVTEHADGD